MGKISTLPLTLLSQLGIDSCLGSGWLEITYMPGNPEECRLHALTCVRLAQTSVTRQARDHFAKLARTWIRLAEDLERSRALLDEVAADSEATG
jgi:hypothetical protein